MNPKRLSAAFLALALASISLVNPASATSHDPAPATSDPATTVAAEPLSVTVPVFGTSMVITIVTDAAGEFVSADLTPAPDSADPAGDAALAAGFDLTVDPKSGGGFEVKFKNTTAGVEIEVRVNDGAITKTEVEAYDPSQATGDGIWSGDPLGNGQIVNVDYSVLFDALTGDPSVQVNSINGFTGTDGTVDIDVPGTAAPDTFFQVLSPTTRSEDDESKTIQTIQFYNAAGDSMELVIKVEFEHGKLEVKVSLKDPNAKKHGDDGDDDDRRGDDDDDDDDEDEDHGGDRSREREHEDDDD